MEKLRRVDVPVLKFRRKISTEDMAGYRCNLESSFMSLKKSAVSENWTLFSGSRSFIEFSARKRLRDRKCNRWFLRNHYDYRRTFDWLCFVSLRIVFSWDLVLNAWLGCLTRQEIFLCFFNVIIKYFTRCVVSMSCWSMCQFTFNAMIKIEDVVVKFFLSLFFKFCGLGLKSLLLMLFMPLTPFMLFELIVFWLEVALLRFALKLWLLLVVLSLLISRLVKYGLWLLALPLLICFWFHARSVLSSMRSCV